MWFIIMQVIKDRLRGETRCLGTCVILQSAVTFSSVLPPLCGIPKSLFFPLSLSIPMEYPLSKKCSYGHLGKLRKEYVGHSTPRIYTLVGNIGLKERDLAILRNHDMDLFWGLSSILVCV